MRKKKETGLEAAEMKELNAKIMNLKNEMQHYGFYDQNAKIAWKRKGVI